MKTSVRLIPLSGLGLMAQHCLEDSQVHREPVQMYFKIASGQQTVFEKLSDNAIPLIRLENNAGEARDSLFVFYWSLPQLRRLPIIRIVANNDTFQVCLLFTTKRSQHDT